MIPPKEVLQAYYERMEPVVNSLYKYYLTKETIKMEFPKCTLTFKFK